MREVTKAEFFAKVGPLDVSPTAKGSYSSEDYRSEWRLRSGRLVGVSRPYGKTPHYKPHTRYYLCEK